MDGTHPVALVLQDNQAYPLYRHAQENLVFQDGQVYWPLEGPLDLQQQKCEFYILSNAWSWSSYSIELWEICRFLSSPSKSKIYF